MRGQQRLLVIIGTLILTLVGGFSIMAQNTPTPSPSATASPSPSPAASPSPVGTPIGLPRGCGI